MIALNPEAVVETEDGLVVVVVAWRTLDDRDDFKICLCQHDAMFYCDNLLDQTNCKIKVVFAAEVSCILTAALEIRPMIAEVLDSIPPS
ncbi:MAG: hypothetical protein KAS32_10195 [Candidatus Peribacteraceae bacterium]|nr:hypothetical protein [Candidatus Peribacteraceae bacterium]